MPYKEKTIEKKYYSIGEVASMFKVAPSLIRFWEKEFNILTPQKNRKGNRQYTVVDIENFKQIYTLVKDKGFTLQGAKENLKTSKNTLDASAATVESLKKIKDFLIEIRETI